MQELTGVCISHCCCPDVHAFAFLGALSTQRSALRHLSQISLMCYITAGPVDAISEGSTDRLMTLVVVCIILYQPILDLSNM